MEFLSLEPFVPSGSNFESSKQLFLDLGFHINWQVEGYAGLQRDQCRFVLQQFDNPGFAGNFMLSVKVTDINRFREDMITKELPKKYGIRMGEITIQPYGKEVNMIDMAGVCWHFVEQ